MRVSALLLTSFALLAGTAQADMSMGVPEHVATALAALTGHADARARASCARRSPTRPSRRRPATTPREALAALKKGDRPAAIEHATNGAAVEHFSYAVTALEAKHDSEAKMHLREARDLAPYAKYAKAALSDLKAGKHTAACAEGQAGPQRRTAA